MFFSDLSYAFFHIHPPFHPNGNSVPLSRRLADDASSPSVDDLKMTVSSHTHQHPTPTALPQARCRTWSIVLNQWMELGKAKQISPSTVNRHRRRRRLTICQTHIYNSGPGLNKQDSDVFAGFQAPRSFRISGLISCRNPRTEMQQQMHFHH